jgi:hypothetical protein
MDGARELERSEFNPELGLGPKSDATMVGEEETSFSLSR